MPASAVCEKCGKRFDPLETEEADLIRRAAKAKWKKLNVDCPHCGKYTAINPVAVVAGKDGTVVSTPTYRCPVSACAGWVDFIDDGKEEPFWGCGECGSTRRTCSRKSRRSSSGSPTARNATAR